MLAGNDGGGDLAAGEDGGSGVFDLGAARGVGGERDDGVGCVEANADEVNLRGFRHGLTVNELDEWAGGGLFDEPGQGFGGGAEDDFVEGFDVEGFFGAYVDGADAAL